MGTGHTSCVNSDRDDRTWLIRKRKKAKARGNNMKDYLNNKKVWAIGAVIVLAVVWNHFYPVV